MYYLMLVNYKQETKVTLHIFLKLPKPQNKTFPLNMYQFTYYLTFSNYIHDIKVTFHVLIKAPELPII